MERQKRGRGESALTQSLMEGKDKEALKKSLSYLLSFQHDGCRVGGVPGHGARSKLLCLQEPLLCRHEEVVSGHLQGLNTTRSQVIKNKVFLYCTVPIFVFIFINCLI